MMKPDVSREEYVVCLRRLYGIVLAWEEMAEERSSGEIHGLLLSRQRRYLLGRDLARLGAEMDLVPRPVLPEMQDRASLLGAMYVMEGSTLGGQLIAPHVEEVLHLGDGEGTAFFRGHRERTGVLWREFCELLKTQVAEEEEEALIGAARKMFQAFRLWMSPTG